MKKRANRLQTTFLDLKNKGRTGLVGYLTAGDPDIAASEKDIRCALSNGVDVMEIGVPFSDPTADGPVIQAAARRALAKGIRVADVLSMVSRIRRDFDQPIILFGYANPFYHYGYGKLCRDAAKAGADGFLVVDLPEEEIGELRLPAKKNGLACIPLVAPTTDEDRARRILKEAEGFVYYIMVTGVTGRRDSIAADLDDHITLLRRCTKLPIAAGFGLSSGKQAADAGRSTDAVVVGSALVEAARGGTLDKLVREIRTALDARTKNP